MARAQNKLIAIDAGHGGDDLCFIDEYKGFIIREQILTWDLAHLIASVPVNGIDAFVVPHHPKTLHPNPKRYYERSKYASAHNADAFISLHFSRSSRDVEGGVTVWYPNESEGSEHLATRLASVVSEKLSIFNRGVFGAKGGRDPQLTTLGLAAPLAVQVALCYMNREEDMESYFARAPIMARAILTETKRVLDGATQMIHSSRS